MALAQQKRMVLRRSRKAIPVVFRSDEGATGKGRIVRIASDGAYIRTSTLIKPRLKIRLTIGAENFVEIEGIVRWIRSRGDDAGFYCTITSRSDRYAELFESLLVS